jgi:hypothetical protein
MVTDSSLLVTLCSFVSSRWGRSLLRDRLFRVGSRPSWSAWTIHGEDEDEEEDEENEGDKPVHFTAFPSFPDTYIFTYYTETTIKMFLEISFTLSLSISLVKCSPAHTMPDTEGALLNCPAEFRNVFFNAGAWKQSGWYNKTWTLCRLMELQTGVSWSCIDDPHDL